MLFNAQILTLAAIFSTVGNSRPLDAPKPRNIVARSKSYAIINVDGGSSTEAPPQATTVVQETTTVDVVNPGPTVTQAITSAIQPAPAQTTTSSSSSCPSTSARSTNTTTSPNSTISSSPSVSSSISIETPEPVIVTVTVSEDNGPTQYYDNGLWHTYYRIKTLKAVVATSTSSQVASSSTILPVLETPALSYNQTTS